MARNIFMEHKSDGFQYKYPSAIKTSLHSYQLGFSEHPKRNKYVYFF